MMKFQLRKNYGFSLLEVMISIGLAAIVALTVMAAVGSAKKPLTAAKLDSTSLALRNSIIRMLSKPGSWNTTVKNNAAVFSCAKNSTGCGAGAAFNIWDEAGTAVYLDVSAGAKKGFTHDGTICTGTTLPPTAACPLRIDTNFTSIKTNAAPAQILVTVTFTEWDPARKVVVTKDNLKINMYKTVTTVDCYLKNGKLVGDGGSIVAYQYGAGSCASTQTRNCDTGILDGSDTYSYSICNVGMCPGGLYYFNNGCWLLAPAGASCSPMMHQGCAAYNGSSYAGPDEALMNAAGSGGPGGSDAQCKTLYETVKPLTLGSGPASGATDAAGVDGCYFDGTNPRRSLLSTVGLHVPSAGVRRVCACYFSNIAGGGANCTLTGDGTVVAHGATARAYSSGTSSCSTNELRTCNNGSFTSGTYTYGGCTTGCAVGLTGFNGYCWKYGTAGATCDTVCTAMGKVCVVAGLTAAGSGGSGGTEAECQNLLLALGVSSPSGTTTQSLASGCRWVSGHAKRGSQASTCAATVTSSEYRACSCN